MLGELSLYCLNVQRIRRLFLITILVFRISLLLDGFELHEGLDVGLELPDHVLLEQQVVSSR